MKSGYTLLVRYVLLRSNPFLWKYSALKEKYAEEITQSGGANLANIPAFFHPNKVISLHRRNSQGWMKGR